MTNHELDVLQARLSAGHFDIEEVSALMAQANLAISMLRRNAIQTRAHHAENSILHATHAPEKSTRPGADPG